MKSTAVNESLFSINQQFCSRENQLLQMLQQNEKSTQIYIRKLRDKDHWNYLGIGRSYSLGSATSRIIEYLFLDVYIVS